MLTLGCCTVDFGISPLPHKFVYMLHTIPKSPTHRQLALVLLVHVCNVRPGRSKEKKIKNLRKPPILS